MLWERNRILGSSLLAAGYRKPTYYCCTGIHPWRPGLVCHPVRLCHYSRARSGSPYRFTHIPNISKRHDPSAGLSRLVVSLCSYSFAGNGRSCGLADRSLHGCDKLCFRRAHRSVFDLDLRCFQDLHQTSCHTRATYHRRPHHDRCLGFSHGHLRLHLERHRHRPGLAIPRHGSPNRWRRLPSSLCNHLERTNQGRCSIRGRRRALCRPYRMACHRAPVLWQLERIQHWNGISNLGR